MNADGVPPSLRQLRLIIPAMAMGVILFAAVVVFLVTSGSITADAALANVLLLALTALAAAELVGYLIARKALTGRLRQQWLGHAAEDVPPHELARAFQALTLIGAAMAEGLSLFGLVIVLVTGSWPAIVAPAIGLLLIALLFPTPDKFSRFAGSITGQPWT
jgi:hypothetical protein